MRAKRNDGEKGASKKSARRKGMFPPTAQATEMRRLDHDNGSDKRERGNNPQQPQE